MSRFTYQKENRLDQGLYLPGISTLALKFVYFLDDKFIDSVLKVIERNEIMINWDEFEHIHVIKKLKHILSAWWNIDVVYTDERGVLKG